MSYQQYSQYGGNPYNNAPAAEGGYAAPPVRSCSVSCPCPRTRKPPGPRIALLHIGLFLFAVARHTSKC